MQHKMMTLLAAAFQILAHLSSVNAESEGYLHGAVISQSPTFTYFQLVASGYKKIKNVSPGSKFPKACAMGPATIVQDETNDGIFQVGDYNGKGDTISARLFCADDAGDLVDAKFFYLGCDAVITRSETGSNVVSSFCDTVQNQ